MTGRPASELDPEPVRRRRHVEVSSIVEIDAVSPETAIRVTTLLMSAVKVRPPGDDPLQIKTIHNEERAHLKIILVGGMDDTGSLFKIIKAVLES